ncbi:sulfite exporter TauE/SafE family protein [Nocardioides sp. W7]|uniref:sulfite exporter TauE/SafE family protein n=1 Tax=Nocardioides sp. W7 TaxID=2931390 RepID=UPI001FD0B14B|nr:sulfite exporter TauE/SafE family protein [Nocardioides sp. W7]
MEWQRDALALLVGFTVATLTAPVGVSGAVFLLPVQLSVLQVPNPQVTPTNLLFNVVSGPGALWRYWRRRQLDPGLVRALLLGCVPGVVMGAVLRVHLVSDPTTFRLVAAAVLLPTGLFILWPRRGGAGARTAGLSRRSVSVLALVVGIVGGLYGIGGGSILGPLLVGSGLAVTVVAPAALASTMVTSVVGVVAFALLALGSDDHIAPDWSIGIASGLGGLVGGYVGATLQPHLPEPLLRRLLGLAAVAVAVAYLVQSLSG